MGLKKVIASLLAVVSIMTVMSVPAFAVAPTETIDERPLSEAVALLDTSNEDIGIAIFIDEDEIQPLAYQTTSKSSSGRFYLKSNDKTLGNFKCTGYFSYDGTICNVTDVSASTSNCEQGYKMTYSTDTKQVSPTYACATGEFSMYKLGLFGSESLESTAVINIFCNQKGTTTVEYNGD